LSREEKIARWGRWVLWTFPVLAWPFRRWAIRKLVEHVESPDAIPHLVSALTSKDRTVAAAARRALRSLKNSRATDALIDLALGETHGDRAIPLINQARYRHSDEGRRFLYLALAGRFDDYLSEDFEFQRLRVEFRAASSSLQARIRETILKSGDTRMNPLFVAEQREKILADLTDQDAEVLLKVNVRNRNWEDLFRYLYVLPARHILRAVQAMAQAGWRPDDPDRAALHDRLASIGSAVREAPEPVRAGTPIGPVFRKWMAERETGALTGKPESELRGKLKENVPPPDQIAALAALRKSGKLTNDDLSSAAHSPHWVVRMSAAAMGAPIAQVNDGGMLWFERLAPILDVEAVWGEKPCRVTRDGLEALQEGLERLPDKKTAGGLLLVGAVAAHYTAHDIELDLGGHVMVTEDSFEMVQGSQ
jgi:hypothetical protein